MPTPPLTPGAAPISDNGCVDADGELIRIVDAAMAEAARKSGAWLVCRPGCWECCVGPFPITQADARRLRAGLAELEAGDAARAARVRWRAAAATERDDEPCPALDPETGACDLYAARPVTCRVFGPPVQWGGDAVGVCELCFHGASDAEIAACAVELEIAEDESQPTSVAGALLSTPARFPAST
jgi:Fe-S-cluster containining protein